MLDHLGQPAAAPDFRPGDLVDLLQIEPGDRRAGRRSGKCDLRIWSIHDKGSTTI
jgi:hypothetical protein